MSFESEVSIVVCRNDVTRQVNLAGWQALLVLAIPLMWGVAIGVWLRALF